MDLSVLFRPHPARGFQPHPTLVHPEPPNADTPSNDFHIAAAGASIEPQASDAPPSIAVLRDGAAPFVLADSFGLVVEVNAAFEAAYGWSQVDLERQSLSLILPEVFQMAHHLGFSRFQSTGQSQILAHPLRLRTVCRDGREVISEHFIVAERCGEGWLFGATLTPLPDGTATDA